MNGARHTTSTRTPDRKRIKSWVNAKKSQRELAALVENDAEFDSVTLSKFEKDEVNALPDEVIFFFFFFSYLSCLLFYLVSFLPSFSLLYVFIRQFIFNLSF